MGYCSRYLQKMAAMKWVSLLLLILHALNVQCAGKYVHYTLIVVQLWKMMYLLI